MLRKMIKNKAVLLVTNKSFIDKSKEVGINTFLFPFKGYSVGFETTFSLNEINEDNSYLYINRALENKDINELKEIFKNINSNIKGIYFEDLGLIPVLENIKLEKILFAHHLTCNYKSINYYLEYVDSLVISTDITEEEMKEILVKSNKKLGIFSFGLISLMYSRRTLLTNFNNFYKREKNKEEVVTEPVTKKRFKFIENEFGTVVYLNKYYNNLKMEDDKISFYLINPLDLREEDFDELLNSLEENKEPEFRGALTTEGFLHKKTIAKLPPKEGVR